MKKTKLGETQNGHKTKKESNYDKNQILTKPTKYWVVKKIENGDTTYNLKLWKKNFILTKLKTQIMTKFKNKNCDQTKKN